MNCEKCLQKLDELRATNMELVRASGKLALENMDLKKALEKKRKRKKR
jgi:hypothetical protein